MGLIIILALWLFVAPIIIMNNIGTLRENLSKKLDKSVSDIENRMKQQMNEIRLEISRMREFVASRKASVTPTAESFSQTEKERESDYAAYSLSPDYAAVRIPAAPFIPVAEPVPALESDLFVHTKEATPEAKLLEKADDTPADTLEEKVETGFEVLSVFNDGFFEKHDKKVPLIIETSPIEGLAGAKTPDKSFATEEAPLESILENGAPFKVEQEQKATAPHHSNKLVNELKTSEPDVIELAFLKLKSWLLTEGNIWVCAGVLLFLVGFGLLFNYAIQRGFLTLEMRLAAASITGLAMAGFGFKIRERRQTYGLILQGGGMGILYLVVLAATKYNLLSTGQPILTPAFAIVAMLVLSIFTVMLALLQNFQPLAIFAILGGFAAPLLVSTDSGNYVALFSIYTLLNLEILALSFKRDWRLLSRMGFVATAAIGVTWGINNWSPELFISVEPFLLAFFATYTLIALANPGFPDFILAVSAPFAFFFLQTQVAGHLKYGMVITCLGLGLWHLLFGAWLRGSGKLQKDRVTLSRIYMFLCILFSNLAIPYLFDNTLSSAIWAIEGAFLIGAACRTGSYKALIGGIALHIGAMALYAHELRGMIWNAGERISPILVSGILFTFALLCSGFCSTRFRPDADSSAHDKWEEAMQRSFGDGDWAREVLPWVFTILGSFWWWGTIYDQAIRLDAAYFSLFTVSCVTALVGSLMSVKLNWKAARFTLLCPIAIAFIESATKVIPFLGYTSLNSLILYGIGQYIHIDALFYMVFVGAALYVLRGEEKTFSSPVTLFSASLSGIYMAEEAVSWCVIRFGFNNDLALLFSILPLFGLLLFMKKFYLSDLEITQRKNVANPIACATGIFMFYKVYHLFISIHMPGAAFLSVYIPILNPLELWQVAVLFSLALWIGTFVLEGRSFVKWSKSFQWGFATLLFVWLNQVAIRASWHYWGETPYYRVWEVFFTTSCQAIIAIFWGFLGLFAILYGQKTRSRDLWRAGAILLSADVIKLLFIDLRGSETLVRIVAFLVLGGLYLLIGWIAPLPPKEE